MFVKHLRTVEAIWGTKELRFQTWRSHSEMTWRWLTIPAGDFPFLVAAGGQDPQRASIRRKRSNRASSSTPDCSDKWERWGALGHSLSSGPCGRLGRQATHSRQQNKFSCILLMLKKQGVSESLPQTQDISSLKISARFLKMLMEVQWFKVCSQMLQYPSLQWS